MQEELLNQRLVQARCYEIQHKQDTDSDRSIFHFTPMTGWCNDPNGFSVYKGEYHLFYQYYPYDVKWGTMHWGHAKTKDFITWEYLPAALAPDENYDKDGCYSGSAIELDDERQLLIYTACHYPDEPAPRLHQEQCIAIGDGIDYKKITANPVIKACTIPEEYDHVEFRDPKIWKDETGYHLLVSNCLKDGSGVILLYESQDAFHWQFVSVLAKNDHQYGTMWECPDFFKLEDKEVLFISPIGMEGDGKEFHSGHGNIAIVGHYDNKSHTFARESVHVLDHGTDFYAMQTLLSPDGRRIMIAWMQNWGTTDYKITGTNFFGEMTIPRELSLKDGRILQQPVREIENYYANTVTYSGITLKESLSLEGVSGHVADMSVILYFNPDNGDGGNDFEILLRDDGKEHFIISYDAQHGCFLADRSLSGITMDQFNTRRFFATPHDNIFKLRILVDRYSVELFINDGECTATFLINCNGTGIIFRSEEETTMDVTFHKIEK